MWITVNLKLSTLFRIHINAHGWYSNQEHCKSHHLISSTKMSIINFHFQRFIEDFRRKTFKYVSLLTNLIPAPILSDVVVENWIRNYETIQIISISVPDKTKHSDDYFLSILGRFQDGKTKPESYLNVNNNSIFILFNQEVEDIDQKVTVVFFGCVFCSIFESAELRSSTQGQ